MFAEASATQFDRVEWHLGAGFPKDLPKEAAATHIGMFMAWALQRKHEAYVHREAHLKQVEAVRARTMTGARFVLECCDAKLSDHDLNGEGSAFAAHYYAKTYLTDYVDTLGADVDTVYHVPDTWDRFDQIARVIDKRFAAWKEKLNAPPKKKKRKLKRQR